MSFVRVHVIRDRPLQGLPMGSHRGPLQVRMSVRRMHRHSTPRDALGCTRWTIVSQVTVAPGNSFMHGRGHCCWLCIHVNGIPASDGFRLLHCCFAQFKVILLENQMLSRIKIST